MKRLIKRFQYVFYYFIVSCLSSFSNHMNGYIHTGIAVRSRYTMSDEVFIFLYIFILDLILYVFFLFFLLKGNAI